MLFQPAILALLLASLVSSVMVVARLPFTVRVRRRWDLASGSETQLAMELRTYLVATVVKIVLIAELAALLLFVFNADRMAAMFTGAMCAVGTLNVNGYVFPALYLKIAVFFSPPWLALDYVDSRDYDYPLVRVKYAALIALAPVMVAATIAAGVLVLRRGGGGYAAFSATTFLVAIVAVVSTASVYVYGLPHHHSRSACSRASMVMSVTPCTCRFLRPQPSASHCFGLRVALVDQRR